MLDHQLDCLFTPGCDGFGRYDISARANVVELNDAAPISATITLDCRDGKFLSQGPVIQQWDRIYLEATDQFGNICFQEVVHVKKRKRVRATGKGLQLKLICPHQSSNLMTQLIFLPDRRTSGYQTMNDAIAQLVANKGAKDPTIVTSSPFDVANKFGNALSQATSNDYIFEGVKFQDVVDQILTREGDVIANGGAFQFHYFRFRSLYNFSNNTNLDSVALQVFPQGYKNNGGVLTNVPTVTIQKKPIGSAPSNYISTDGDDDTEQATNIIAIGAKNAGSYPVDYSKYQGQLDTFNAAGPWNSATPYLVGQRVNYNNSFYHCTVNIPSGPNPPPTIDIGHWSTAETFTPTVDYSPLTKNKAQYWINAAGGWINAGTQNAEVAIVDPNIIIQDKFHNRSWVDTVATNPASIPAPCLLLGNPFDGLRVLCNGAGAGAFAGSDPTGVPYSNNQIEYRDYVGIVPGWYVLRVSQQDDEIYSFREGISWTYKPCQGIGSYVDGNGVCQIGSRNTAWVQGAYGLLNIPGVGTFGSFNSNGQFDCVHPVKHDAGPNVEIGNEKISPTDLSGTSAVFANFACTQAPRNFFAGLNFAWPWPRNSNGIPYGVVNIGEQIKLFVFDFLNMYKTHTGKVQNFGPEVEDYFPINGFSFFELFQDLLPLGTFKQDGDYSMGIFICDRKDNVVVIEYNHSHNDVTEPQSPALGSVKVYRGIPGVANWLPAQQIEILNIFDWRSGIRGGLYTRDSFDQAGRYFFAANNLFIPGFQNGSRFHNSEKLHLSVDGFMMVKPLVSTNVKDLGAAPDRNLTSQIIKADSIVSKAQLDNLVLSTQRILNFKPQSFVAATQGRGDVKFGDPVYYTDSEIIPDVTDAKNFTLKMVADSITYTISKTADGPGGLTRSINLITRVWPN